jgi:hypothetical protein
LAQKINNAYESHSSFHRGLLITKTQQKGKKFREAHWKYFWSFWFFKRKSKLKGNKNKNEKNYLHGKAPNKQKKNKEIFLGFLLIATKERRKSQKETRKYFWIF